MNIEEKIIGVIGYGNFGKVVCDFLFPKNKIVITTTQKINSERITPVSTLEELTAQADIIIPAVPIRNFEETIKKISHTIKSSTIIMDVCSVKEYPVEVMKEYLPKNQLIATHPMFGPNSIAKKGSLKNMKLMMHNVSAEKNFYEQLKNYFKNLDLDVLEITPEEHDKLSANSQFFALIVAEIAKQNNLTPTIIDTPGASALFDANTFAGADRHIIEDMISFNKFCRPLIKNMIISLQELENKQ